MSWRPLSPTALRCGEVRAFSFLSGSRAVRLAEMRSRVWQASDTTALDRAGSFRVSGLNPDAVVSAVRQNGINVPDWRESC